MFIIIISFLLLGINIPEVEASDNGFGIILAIIMIVICLLLLVFNHYFLFYRNNLVYEFRMELTTILHDASLAKLHQMTTGNDGKGLSQTELNKQINKWEETGRFLDWMDDTSIIPSYIAMMFTFWVPLTIEDQLPPENVNKLKPYM